MKRDANTHAVIAPGGYHQVVACKHGRLRQAMMSHTGGPILLGPIQRPEPPRETSHLDSSGPSPERVRFIMRESTLFLYRFAILFFFAVIIDVFVALT